MDGWKTIVYFLLGVGGLFSGAMLFVSGSEGVLQGFEDLFKYRDSLYVFDHKI